ncbi:MAG: tRNA uridine-5-carboxymethylaminomethyl(34) synthesis GTPase MnmE [Candidatus Brocadiia bacterium]
MTFRRTMPRSVINSLSVWLIAYQRPGHPSILIIPDPEMCAKDTIIAVSTPRGFALRSIIRLSGEKALNIAENSFVPDGTGTGWMQTYRATTGDLVFQRENLRVPATIYVMKGPKSYTREDVIEFHLPGSPAILDMVLDEFLERNEALRLARPGEFTQRAFLNGRIDLTQAEAVLSVIRARNEAELVAANAKLAGKVSDECHKLQDQIGELRARTEAALDFAQHGIDLIGKSEFISRCEEIRERLEQQLNEGRGELASDGRVHVVLCGPPNAGKSSLLNRLAEDDVALVHEVPGTTRDAVQGEAEIEGICFSITDTAGLRDEAGKLEEEAGNRARSLAAGAQLLVLVLDGSQELPHDALDPAKGTDPERVLCVINKCDLPEVLDEKPLEDVAWEAVHVSALTGEGMDKLESALGRVVMQGRLDASAADCLFNARQRESVRRAAACLHDASSAVQGSMGYEFAALDLREANEALGEVTGQVEPQDVLDRVFSRFCIGK